jgi:hypothetical protein
LKTLNTPDFQKKQKELKRKKEDPLGYQHWMSETIYKAQMKLYEGKL